MTVALNGHDVARRIRAAFAEAVTEEDDGAVTVVAGRVVEVARFLRDDPDLDCKYLNGVTAVDWIDHFEIVYHLSSLAKNQALVLKARADHENPSVPSVTSVWLGANLQEREIFDLMGIVFSGHPAMRRIFLWEGFPGHPLRKDFLNLPGGVRPGLQRFPFEFKEGERGYPGLLGPEVQAAPAPPAAEAETEAAPQEETQRD